VCDQLGAIGAGLEYSDRLYLQGLFLAAPKTKRERDELLAVLKKMLPLVIGDTSEADELIDRLEKP
jgi:hypothetical protein